MRISGLTKVIVIGLGLVSLAACSKKPNGAGMAGGGDMGQGGVQTYGAGGDGSYGSMRHNQYGEVINPLTAPSPQTYYFQLDSSEARPEDMKAMSIQANYLVAHRSARIRLEGNTDERGSREYNIALGWRRVRAIEAIFEQQGVQPNQIVKMSYGKERPVALGHDEAAWRLNRRVDLVYEVTQ